MTSQTLPIFINGSTVQAPSGCTLAKVLSVHSPELFAWFMDGTGSVTDARGLPVDPESPVYAGAIYRILRSARRDEDIHA